SASFGPRRRTRGQRKSARRAMPPRARSCHRSLSEGRAGDGSAFGLQLTSRFLARATVALDFVGNLLVFVQAAQAGLLDGRDVDEDVLAAVIRLDEAVALGGVEPFYSAGSHFQDLR